MTQGSGAVSRGAHPPSPRGDRAAPGRPVCPTEGHRPCLRGPRPTQAGTLETPSRNGRNAPSAGVGLVSPDRPLDLHSPPREEETEAGRAVRPLPTPRPTSRDPLPDSEPRAPRGTQPATRRRPPAARSPPRTHRLRRRRRRLPGAAPARRRHRPGPAPTQSARSQWAAWLGAGRRAASRSTVGCAYHRSGLHLPAPRPRGCAKRPAAPRDPCSLRSSSGSDTGPGPCPRGHVTCPPSVPRCTGPCWRLCGDAHWWGPACPLHASELAIFLIAPLTPDIPAKLRTDPGPATAAFNPPRGCSAGPAPG